MLPRFVRADMLAAKRQQRFFQSSTNLVRRCQSVGAHRLVRYWPRAGSVVAQSGT
jgi:hypothetical protein